MRIQQILFTSILLLTFSTTYADFSENSCLTKAWQLTNLAKSFVGVKYHYGGSTPKGFDCSGYVMYIYQQFGYKLPHSAVAQLALGKKVIRTELYLGDLVFFATQKGNPNYVSHVGIYLGEGDFIHASSSRGQVLIDHLRETYYQCHYRGGRRILEDEIFSTNFMSMIHKNSI